jgi:hypothetical protein
MIESIIGEYIGQGTGESTGGGGPVSVDLPHLTISHNDENADNGNLNKLLGSSKKSAEALYQQILAYGNKFGVEKLAFLTVTFAGEAPTMEYAMKCFKVFLNSFLRRRYVAGVRVTERGDKKGRLHFHIVVVMDQDVRTGFDFSKTNYKGENPTASPYFQVEHEAIKAALAKYGFGPVHWFEPAKESLEALARYVAAYVAKNISKRLPGDKKARLWGCWGDVPRACSCQFARVTPNRWLWGQKVKIWAASHGFMEGEGRGQSFDVMDRLKEVFGARWCFHFQKDILAVDIKEHGLQYKTPESEKEDRKVLDEIWVPRFQEFSDIRDSFKGEVYGCKGLKGMEAARAYYFRLCEEKMTKIAMRKQIKESSSAPDLRTVTKPDIGERYERRKFADGLKRENLAAKMDDMRYGAMLKTDWENKEYRMDHLMQVADEMERAGGGT